MASDEAGKDVDLDAKKANIVKRIEQREEQRLISIAKKQNEKAQTDARNEKVEDFCGNFDSRCNVFEKELNDVKQDDNLSEQLDKLTTDLSTIQKFLTDSTLFLPKRELQRTQDRMLQLMVLLKLKRKELLPKKKFGFKSKKATKSTGCSKITNETSVKVEASLPKDTGYNVTLVDSNNEELSQSRSALLGKDVLVGRLEKCQVHLRGSPAALTISNLKDCHVFCGPVSGSVFVDCCHDSTIVVGCQQLRMHNSSNCKIYLHVTSRAIIEDSSGLVFAPYLLDYEGMDSDFAASGLAKEGNNWQEVDDFNWLVNGEHSPNWRLLPEDQRTDNFLM